MPGEAETAAALHQRGGERRGWKRDPPRAAVERGLHERGQSLPGKHHLHGCLHLRCDRESNQRGCRHESRGEGAGLPVGRKVSERDRRVQASRSGGEPACPDAKGLRRHRPQVASTRVLRAGIRDKIGKGASCTVQSDVSLSQRSGTE